MWPSTNRNLVTAPAQRRYHEAGKRPQARTPICMCGIPVFFIENGRSISRAPANASAGAASIHGPVKARASAGTK